MKKLISLLLFSAVTLACISGCASSSTSSTTAAPAAPATTAASTNNSASAAPAANAPAETTVAAAKEISWPTDTVQLIVPAKAGGNSDILARVFSSALEKNLGKPIVIVNQTEGNGTVAYNTVKDAKPDGYTLLFHLMTMYAQAYTGIYDVDVKASFTPIIALTGNTGFGMVVRGDSEFNTAQEVADYIKANPGKMTFGCQLGGTSHMMPAAFAKWAGGDFRYVDTGGDADRRTALLGGNVDITLQSCSAIPQYVASGDMKCLGVWTGDGQRDPAAPDLATFKEMGIDVTWPTTYFCMGPDNMDPALVDAINAAFKECMDDPAFMEQMQTAGFYLDYNNVADSTNFLNDNADYIKGVCEFLGY